MATNFWPVAGLGGLTFGLALHLVFFYMDRASEINSFDLTIRNEGGGSVVEWLACWTQAQTGPGSNRSRDAVG